VTGQPAEAEQEGSGKHGCGRQQRACGRGLILFMQDTIRWSRDVVVGGRIEALVFWPHILALW